MGRWKQVKSSEQQGLIKLKYAILAVKGNVHGIYIHVQLFGF